MRLRKFNEDGHELADLYDPGINVTGAVLAGNECLLEQLAAHLPAVPEQALRAEQERQRLAKMINRWKDPFWAALSANERARRIKEERGRSQN